MTKLDETNNTTQIEKLGEKVNNFQKQASIFSKSFTENEKKMKEIFENGEEINREILSRKKIFKDSEQLFQEIENEISSQKVGLEEYGFSNLSADVKQRIDASIDHLIDFEQKINTFEGGLKQKSNSLKRQ